MNNDNRRGTDSLSHFTSADSDSNTLSLKSSVLREALRVRSGVRGGLVREASGGGGGGAEPCGGHESDHG
jgi:hypothetical protein